MGRTRKEMITKVIIFENDKKETPLYRTLAYQEEKKKGLMIIQKLKNFFGINNNDLRIHLEREVIENGKRSNKIKWTRDKKGNIISPFSKKAQNESK